MRLGPIWCVLGLLSTAACAGNGGTSGRPASSPAFDDVVALATAGSWRSVGEDVIEVWVCHVPPDSTAEVYGGLPLRRPLTPQHLTDTIAAGVAGYFEAISHGTYHPVLVAGGEVTMSRDDRPQDCVDRAIAGAGAATRAVLAVADAEHAPGQPGGFGTGGDPCGAPCSVADSRRAAYVGAADFAPEWGDDPPLDLVEHEIGHTLGWVHSGVDAAGDYLSALDVMSNSAAPRDIDPSRRDGPDTLAVERVVAGWLPAVAVVVAGTSGTDVTLAPSTGNVGTRLLVLPVDESTFLAVESLPLGGYDAHLANGGIAVHRVRLDGGALRPLEPLVGVAPFSSLLAPGATFTSDGWTLSVGDGGQVSARPSP